MCSNVGAFQSVPAPSIREPHQQQRQFCASASVRRFSFESVTIGYCGAQRAVWRVH